MEKYIYPSDGFNKENIDTNILISLVTKHFITEVVKIEKCFNYYDGKHEILNNNDRKGIKVVCNHAKDIVDTATGYFMSNPITYTAKEDKKTLDTLTDYFDKANLEDVDQDNALDMSKCGVAYEYVYAKEGESVPNSKNIDPRNCFIVIDDTIEEKELFGVYYERTSSTKDKAEQYKMKVATDTDIQEYTFSRKGKELNITKGETIEHHFGAIPFIQFKNNKDGFGDFEQQMSLIDAYNTITSDRIDDKEQFLKSILVIYGAILGDDAKESTDAMQKLREAGLLELQDGTKAEYITRTFDENGIEVLKGALKEDIYTFSHVPCLTDKNFVGNSSGVAMEYKLLGLEMITKTKSRFYSNGLKKRIILYCNFLNLKSLALNPASITINFTRGLPKNLVEIASMIANLDGKVSDRTLISQLPFVDDPDGEIKEVSKQKEENIKNQQKAMGFDNTTIEEETTSNEENTKGVA